MVEPLKNIKEARNYITGPLDRKSEYRIRSVACSFYERVEQGSIDSSPFSKRCGTVSHLQQSNYRI